MVSTFHPQYARSRFYWSADTPEEAINEIIGTLRQKEEIGSLLNARMSFQPRILYVTDPDGQHSGKLLDGRHRVIKHANKILRDEYIALLESREKEKGLQL